MALRNFDKILNEYTKHTNLTFPHNDFVSSTSFPEQDEYLLNRNVRIPYRNMYSADSPNKISESKDRYYTYMADCKIVRADKKYPYRMICISLDFNFIFVTDTRNYGYICQYPIQLDDFIGVTVEDLYLGSLDRINGIVLRADNGEPCYSIILEYINDSYRFVLGDECLSIMKDYSETERKTRNDTIETRKRVLENIMKN